MKGVSVIVIYCLPAIFQIFLEQYVVVFNCTGDKDVFEFF